MSVAKQRKGASNCHYICILTIVKTLPEIIPYKEIHLRNISSAKYVMAKKSKLRKKEVAYIETPSVQPFVDLLTESAAVFV